jgi:phosphoribosyl 1,2-cyclic phosphodiesterase
MDIRVLASGSSGNCYRISDGQSNLLLEAGIPFKQIQQGLDYKLSEISACLVSHGHMDHCKAVKDIIKAGIDVYTSRPTAEALDVQDSHRVQMIDALAQFKVGTFIVLPFTTEHDCPGSLGFLIQSTAIGEKMVFITDSFYCHYSFRGLTHIMVEANYAIDILQKNIETGYISEEMRKRLVHSHFSLENVKKFLKANDLSRVQEIYLMHLSRGNSDEVRFKLEVQQVTGKQVIVC